MGRLSENNGKILHSETREEQKVSSIDVYARGVKNHIAQRVQLEDPSMIPCAVMGDTRIITTQRLQEVSYGYKFIDVESPFLFYRLDGVDEGTQELFQQLPDETQQAILRLMRNNAFSFENALRCLEEDILLRRPIDTVLRQQITGLLQRRGQTPSLSIEEFMEDNAEAKELIQMLNRRGNVILCFACIRRMEGRKGADAAAFAMSTFSQEDHFDEEGFIAWCREEELDIQPLHL